MGCSSNNDCPKDQQCYSGQCVSPCRSSSNPCPRTAQCRVVDHAPTCLCPQGTTGVPLQGCFPLPACGYNSQCRDNEICVDRLCRDPCLTIRCGSFSICRTTDHRPACECLDDYIENELGVCVPDGCTSERDCPPGARCQFSKCVSPCSECGVGAQCSRVGSQTVCMCPAGTSGNPTKECVTSKPRPSLDL